MTKASVFSTLVLLSACASTATMGIKNSRTFDAVKNVFASSPSQNQILENFGKPDVRKKDGDKELWRYFDPATKFDRVQFSFNESKALVQLFWIPLPGEAETKVEGVFAHYPLGRFKAIDRRRTSKHSLQTDTTYSDGESMSILNDDASKEVQAVAWFTPISKLPDSKNPMTSR